MFAEVEIDIAQLYEGDNACAAIIDLWGSSNMVGYCGTSSLFVTKDFIPFTAMLSLSEMPKHHTAAAILADHDKTLKKLNLQDKVVIAKLLPYWLMYCCTPLVRYFI